MQSFNSFVVTMLYSSYLYYQGFIKSFIMFHMVQVVMYYLYCYLRILDIDKITPTRRNMIKKFYENWNFLTILYMDIYKKIQISVEKQMISVERQAMFDLLFEQNPVIQLPATEPNPDIDLPSPIEPLEN